jgi:hypothetical protein
MSSYQETLDAVLTTALQRVIPEVDTGLLLHICQDTDFYREAVRIGSVDDAAMDHLMERVREGDIDRMALSLRVSLIDGLREHHGRLEGGAFERLAVVAMHGGN